jgi:hypothetical protein
MTTPTTTTAKPSFSVWQCIQGEGSCLLYSGCTEEQARDEADRLNQSLESRGIPSFVARTYILED